MRRDVTVPSSICIIRLAILLSDYRDIRAEPLLGNLGKRIRRSLVEKCRNACAHARFQVQQYGIVTVGTAKFHLIFDKLDLLFLSCKIDREKEFVRNAPKMSDYLSEDSLHYFNKVQMYLKALDIPFMIDDRLVRGLDYYTDTVFEVVSTNEESGAQSTIFGGGRYDNLVKEMGGPELSGIGFAIGEERLLILAKAEGIFTKEEKSLDAYVVNLLKDDPYALEVLSILRANSYSGEMDYYNRSLKAQFKSADRRKVRFTIIVGEDEKKTQSVNVKDAKTKMQDNVRLDDLIDYLDEKMGEEYE